MSSWSRRALTSLLVVLPGVAAVGAVALAGHDAPGGLDRRGLATLALGLGYLVLCVGVRHSERSVARVALLGWTVALCGGAIVLAWPHLHPEPPDSRIDADGFDDPDWTRAYFDEFHAANKAHWESYVYWRRLPYAGRHIQVRADGLRHTWSPPAADDARPTVLMFGGSTMWGTGADDDETIPSLLARRLHELGLPADVRNHGETGYVSTQCLLALLLELRRGNVPDVVVFYDGANDVCAAHQSGEAGIPLNESHRRIEFERTTGVRDTRVREPGDPAALGRAVVDHYLGNLALLDALAARFGFAYRCYWQPVPYVGKPLTAYEREASENTVPGLPAFFRAHYLLVREREPPPGFRDLSALFDAETAPLYLDWCHLTAAGNAAVAAAMLEDLAPLVAAARKGR